MVGPAILHLKLDHLDYLLLLLYLLLESVVLLSQLLCLLLFSREQHPQVFALFIHLLSILLQSQLLLLRVLQLSLHFIHLLLPSRTLFIPLGKLNRQLADLQWFLLQALIELPQCFFKLSGSQREHHRHLVHLIIQEVTFFTALL